MQKPVDDLRLRVQKVACTDATLRYFRRKLLRAGWRNEAWDAELLQDDSVLGQSVKTPGARQRLHFTPVQRDDFIPGEADCCTLHHWLKSLSAKTCFPCKPWLLEHQLMFPSPAKCFFSNPFFHPLAWMKHPLHPPSAFPHPGFQHHAACKEVQYIR